jgi:hypothetical protein
MSKYSVRNPFNRNTINNAVQGKPTVKVVTKELEVEDMNKVKKIKGKRQHRVHNHRIFNYRGITFFLISNGDQTTVCVMNPLTSQPEPKIVVNRADAVRAAQTLSKLQLTEKYLEEMSIGEVAAIEK